MTNFNAISKAIKADCREERVINDDFTIKLKHEPGKGIYAISKPVKTYGQAKEEAESMVNWLNANNGHFQAPLITAYAVSHCQVSDEPMAFFVVNKDFINENNLQETKSRNNSNFYFQDQAVFNAKILVATDKIDADVPRREVVKNDKGEISSKVVIEKKLISNKLSVPDRCMSFPNRQQKYVDIYFRIKVEYQIKNWCGRFKTITEWVEGVKAHIFQHEINHSKGKNIYYGTAR